MEHSFEIKCGKCGGTAVDIKIKGAITFSREQGTNVRIKFICLLCGHEHVMTIIQKSIKTLPKEYVYKNGKRYRKIGRHEKIKSETMQSWDSHELQPIRNPKTIGDIPDNFSPRRNFFNPI